MPLDRCLNFHNPTAGSWDSPSCPLIGQYWPLSWRHRSSKHAQLATPRSFLWYLCLFNSILLGRFVLRDKQLATLNQGSATPERVTFQRATFERTIFSDCTFERLTIGAIHHLGECHFSDYQIQWVPISTQPIWASNPRLPGTVWAKAIIAKSRGSSRGQETGPCLPKGQNSNIFFNCSFQLFNSVFEQLYELRHNTNLVILAPLYASFEDT